MEPAAARRPWLVALLVALVVVPLVVAGLVVVLRGPSWLPGVADCTVGRGDRTVELGTGEAQLAASVAARSVRLGLPVGTAATAIQDQVDLSDQDARVVARALTGRAPHSLSCRHGGAAEEESDRLSARGLTARAEVVRRDLIGAFGRQQLGGFAPGGVTTGHMPGSAHYEGRAVDVFYRPVDSGEQATRLGDRAVPRRPRRPARGDHRDLRRSHLDGSPRRSRAGAPMPPTPPADRQPSLPSSSTATTCTSTSPTEHLDRPYPPGFAHARTQVVDRITL